MNPVYLKRFLMVLYAAGLIGMHIPATQNLFISLVPLNLWFTAFICIFYHPRPSFSTYLVLFFIAIAAWLAQGPVQLELNKFESSRYGLGDESHPHHNLQAVKKPS